MTTTATVQPQQPPPYSFESLYSSYQEEWAAYHHQQHQCDGKLSSTSSDVLDLKLWKPTTNKSNQSLYLLACTGSGDVVVWNATAAARTATGTNQEEEEEMCTNNIQLIRRLSVSTGALKRMQIVTVVDANEDRSSKSDKETIIPRVSVEESSRKRKRGPDNDDDDDDETQRPFTYLFVAGERGLWKISLDLLVEEGKTTQSSSSIIVPVMTNHRSILDIQVVLPQQEGSATLLYALESDSLSAWDCSCMEMVQQHSLSRFLAPKKQQQRHGRRSRNSHRYSDDTERATTMLIVYCSTGMQFQALVGTNQSRVWILPLLGKDNIEPQVLSLTSNNDDRFHYPQNSKSAAGNPITTNWRFGESSFLSNNVTNNDTDDVVSSWTVTRIMEQGPWWTVAAKANVESRSSDRSDCGSGGGLLMTWHGPTCSVIDTVSTRECIQNIVGKEASTGSNSMFYSVGNEGFVSVWKSPFQLERTGRLSAEPLPSIKAMDITRLQLVLLEQNNDHVVNRNKGRSIMAVAGVGKQVHLFSDHCRVHTVSITNGTATIQ